MGRQSIELFSDYFAQTINPITRIDARIKLCFILAMLALVLLSDKAGIMASIIAFSMCSLLFVKIPLKVVLARMAIPLTMVGVLLILQGLTFGMTPLYSFGYGSFDITIYEEGIERGFLIAGRALAGTSLVILLSMTTPINKLIGALKFFKVPDGWLEILAFSYRYIFVFIEEAQSIMDAQRLRLGYRGVSTSLKSWGILIGSLFTRVYDQANATHEAMVIRGYRGGLYIKKPERMSAYDVSAGLVLAILFALLSLVAYWG